MGQFGQFGIESLLLAAARRHSRQKNIYESGGRLRETTEEIKVRNLPTLVSTFNAIWKDLFNETLGSFEYI